MSQLLAPRHMPSVQGRLCPSYKLIRSKALLVPAGFAILALSQIFWIYWGFTDLNDVLVVANALYVAGLALLAGALLMILRRRPSYAEVH